MHAARAGGGHARHVHRPMLVAGMLQPNTACSVAATLVGWQMCVCPWLILLPCLPDLQPPAPQPLPSTSQPLPSAAQPLAAAATQPLAAPAAQPLPAAAQPGAHPRPKHAAQPERGLRRVYRPRQGCPAVEHQRQQGSTPGGGRLLPDGRQRRALHLLRNRCALGAAGHAAATVYCAPTVPGRGY